VVRELGSHLIDQALTLFGPARPVHAEIATRRPGAGSPDDAFVALAHDGGVRSHLWMSAVAADPGPRFRVLGSRGAYVKPGLDGQEAALRSGAAPGAPGWGAEPPEAWGTFTTGETASRHPTAPGSYESYYRALAHALHHGGPPPVTAREATRVVEVIEEALRLARAAG
jgi:scyllo-inositol 2-dehydrogenase (NADP+)